MVSTTTSETCSNVHKCMERVINTDTNLVVNVNMTSQREVFFWRDGNSWWVDERIKRLLKNPPSKRQRMALLLHFPSLQPQSAASHLSERQKHVTLFMSPSLCNKWPLGMKMVYSVPGSRLAGCLSACLDV